MQVWQHCRWRMRRTSHSPPQGKSFRTPCKKRIRLWDAIDPINKPIPLQIKVEMWCDALHCNEHLLKGDALLTDNGGIKCCMIVLILVANPAYVRQKEELSGSLWDFRKLLNMCWHDFFHFLVMLSWKEIRCRQKKKQKGSAEALKTRRDKQRLCKKVKNGRGVKMEEEQAVEWKTSVETS